jgi:hypothetical protein
VVRFARALGALVVLATVLGASPAQASPEGKAFFDAGVKHYNLGHFQEAIVEFEKAYNADPAPILLFNIAQSHRQLNNKERALFFYRRYLEQAPAAPNRGEVEQRMKDLAQQLEAEKVLKQKPPTEVETAERGGPGSGPQPPKRDIKEDISKQEQPAPSDVPRPWVAEAMVAPALIGFSGNDVEAPVMISMRLGASYGLPIGEASTVRLGAEALAAVLPYTNTMTAATQNSSMVGFMLTARYLFRPIPKLALGGGIGGGVVWWGGLEVGNPFTEQMVGADAPIPMPSLQVGLRAEYDLASRVFVALSPELLLSKTTSDGLTQSISSVRRFDIDVGVGFRF